MSTNRLAEALTNHLEARDKLSEVAIEEIEAAVATRYPTAQTVEVTAILTDDYTEHSLIVKDDEGKRLNTDDWPEVGMDEDWLMAVTEGACGGEDFITVLVTR